MNEPDGHIIALREDQVVGYCLVMAPKWRDQIEVLKPMFDKIDELSIQGRPLKQVPYVVMGQVCIAKEHRRKGLFQDMYNHFRQCLTSKYEYCITEIATENHRSRGAHERVGFSDLHSYVAQDGRSWEVVVWDWTAAAVTG